MLLGSWSANGSFGSLNNSIESLWVGYGNFTQHLAVQLNIRFFAAVDKFTVPYTTLPAPGT
jgi:hypothetical protein